MTDSATDNRTTELRERRAEFIAKVRMFAETLAREYRCDDVEVDEDRQKGIWGERMTEWLEKWCGGNCSMNIKWSGGERKKVFDYDKELRPARQVKLRFRFDSPCVSVSLDYRDTFAELQFSDYIDDEHSGHFTLHETHAWGYHGGVPLLEKLTKMWGEFE